MRLFGCAAVVIMLMSTGSAWATAGMCVEDGHRLSPRDLSLVVAMGIAEVVSARAEVPTLIAEANGGWSSTFLVEPVVSQPDSQPANPQRFPLLWCVSGEEAGCYPASGHPASPLGAKVGGLASADMAELDQRSSTPSLGAAGGHRSATSGTLIVDRLRRPPRR